MIRPEKADPPVAQRAEGDHTLSTALAVDSPAGQQSNSRQPLLSLVIPWHGEMNLLSHIAHECHRLSADDIEIIVVDDATQGGFPGLPDANLENLVKSILRLAMNCGPGVARNAGLDAASGIYVSFLDADDEAELRGFLNLAREMQSGGAVVGAMSYRTINSSTGVTVEFPVLLPSSRVENLLETYPAVWRYVFKRDWLVESGARFESLRYAEDLLFLLDVASVEPTFVSTPHFGYTHTMNLKSGGLSRRHISVEDLNSTLTELQRRYRRSPSGTLRSITAEWMWRIWLRNLPIRNWRQVPRTMACVPRAMPSAKGANMLGKRIRAKVSLMFNYD